MTTQPARLTISGLDLAQPFHRDRLAYMRAARVLRIRGAYQRKEEAYFFSREIKARSLCFPSVIDTATASVAAQAALANDARQYIPADLAVRYDAEGDAEYVEVAARTDTKHGAASHVIGRLKDDERPVIALLSEGIPVLAFITDPVPGSAKIVIAEMGAALAEWLDIYDDRKARAAERAEAYVAEMAEESAVYVDAKARAPQWIASLRAELEEKLEEAEARIYAAEKNGRKDGNAEHRAGSLRFRLRALDVKAAEHAARLRPTQGAVTVEEYLTEETWARDTAQPVTVTTWGDYVPAGVLAAGLDGEPI